MKRLVSHSMELCPKLDLAITESNYVKLVVGCRIPHNLSDQILDQGTDASLKPPW